VGLRELPYEKLEPLICDYLCDEEFEDTAALIQRLRPARLRGYLTPEELEEICRWKSARALHYIRANTAKQIRVATSAALSTRSEMRRLEALTTLSGVSVPMASAVLMLLDPKRYGVIDIRVWQLMHKVGAVKKNPRGIGFTFQNWYQFLMIIRYFAKKFGVSARLIELTLFLAHKEYQAGRLYLD
jgi:thermostable 8-oxoguanine DNA glycosylase